MAPLDFTIDLPVRSEWGNVERIRASIGSCLLAVSGDTDAGDALALVAAELAENAIKYGHWERAGSFRVRIWGRGVRAHVSVESPLAPGGKGPTQLFDTLRWIERFPSAEAAYQARLLEIAAAPRRADTSKLGLVRLAYEACCTLRAELDGDLLRVIADVTL